MNADEIHDSELTITDEESRAAMRAFLQRSEVRLSTIHRVDELSPNTRELLTEGRDDKWTRALLVPRSTDDDGWRNRFDTRAYEVWKTIADEGAAGDTERLRQAFRLAGLNRDRTLARDVARTHSRRRRAMPRWRGRERPGTGSEQRHFAARSDTIRADSDDRAVATPDSAGSAS